MSNIQFLDKDGLSAFWKKICAAFELKGTALPKTGGTLTGTLNVNDVIPVNNTIWDLGSSSNSFRNIYARSIYENGTDISAKYLGINATAVKATSADSADIASSLANDCVLSDDEITDIVTQYFELNFIGSGSGSGDGISMALEDESNTPEEVSEA